jgi:hypothetical protein
MLKQFVAETSVWWLFTGDIGGKTEEANYGFVEWSLYDSRLKAIGFNKDITRVAVLHHHLVSIPREELLDQDHPLPE